MAKKTSKSKKSTKKSSSENPLFEENKNIILIKDENYKEGLMSTRSELENFVEKELSEFNDYSFESEDDFYDDETYVVYNKLSEDEYNRLTKKFIGRAQAYLEKIGIKEFEIDPKENLIIIPIEFDKLQFLCNILVTPEWYYVKASIIEFCEDLLKIEKDLYFLLLKGNFELNTITYSVDPEKKSVWVEADIPTNAGFEHFRLRYLGIVYGIEYFINNIADKLKAPLESTYKNDFDKQLYI